MQLSPDRGLPELLFIPTRLFQTVAVEYLRIILIAPATNEKLTLGTLQIIVVVRCTSASTRARVLAVVMSEPALAHLSINSSCRSTILFIHGALSSHNEWRAVASHLPTYHLLIPSLPSHGSNASIRPFSTPSSARLLAKLIHDHAKNGRAHVVGLSLGAHIAIHLASRHPDVVADTVFASGINRFSPSAWTPVLPYVVYGGQNLLELAPRSLRAYLIDEDASVPKLDDGTTTTCGMELCREIVASATSDQDREILPAPARTLIVAPQKRGLLPTNDSVQDAKEVLEVMRKGNARSRAVIVKTMRHAWDVQDPLFFAQTLMAWIEDRPLPEQFRDL